MTSKDNKPSKTPTPKGRLILMPCTLDLGAIPEGAPQPSVQDTIPLQALQLAAGLTHWVAENAKTARSFLKRVDAVVPLSTPLQGLDIQTLPRPVKGGQNDAQKLAGKQPGAGATGVSPWKALLGPALQGHDVGLISEAGLPGVADPGCELVWAAHQAGITVMPLSGPSSLVLAISASGLNGQSFAFHGYLPTDDEQRAQRIQAMELVSRKQHQTQLVIETPYRNAALFDALVRTLHPHTRLALACGVTLEQGWCQTRTVAAWREHPVTWPDNVPCVFAWLA
jgi:16S rRNA (cytidine1402-2'-O)-methyltransferase